MKKVYRNPEFNISSFMTENIVTTSGITETKTIEQQMNEKGITSVETNVTSTLFKLTY